MKILHILTDGNIGGAGVLLKNLLIAQRSADIEYAVMLPRGSRVGEILPAEAELIWADIKADKSLSLVDFAELRRKIRGAAPDIVHTHGSLTARMAARSLGIRCVMTRHCAYPTGVLGRAPLRWLSAIVLRATTDAYIATAEAARDNLISLGAPESKIYTIINAPEPQKQISGVRAKELRESLGACGSFVVGVVARLEPEKGHESIIRCAKMLKKYPIKFLFFGDGSLEHELRERARGLDNVRFMGFSPNVGEYMGIFDLLLNASVGTETSCLAISEAMSVGVPCLASNYGGNGYMVRDNGVLFAAGDSEDMAEKLLLLFRDRELLSILSRRARRRFAEEFSLSAMARGYEAVYRSLVRADNIMKSNTRGITDK